MGLNSLLRLYPVFEGTSSDSQVFEDHSSKFGMYLLGLMFACIFSLSVNFLLPLGGAVSCVFALMGTALGIVHHRQWQQLFRKQDLILLGIIIFYVSMIPLQREKWFFADTPLYQMQSIKWAAEEKLALGLANLHGRLAFNSILFPLAALFELPGLEGKSQYYITAFFSILVFWQVFVLIQDYWQNKNKLSPQHIVAALLLVPLLDFLHYIPTSIDYDSIITFQVVSLCLFAFQFLLHFFQKSNQQQIAVSLSNCYLMCLLAGMSKLSASLFAFVPFFFLLYFWIMKRNRLWHKQFIALISLSILSFGPWVLRSLALSGCAFYPLAKTCFSSSILPWASPIDRVIHELSWVKSWARMPKVDPQIVLRDWQWFSSWWPSTLKGLGLHLGRIVLGGVLLLLPFSSGKYSLELWKEVNNTFKAFYFLLLVIFGSLIVWFLGAPDTRFASGQFMAFGVLMLAAGIFKWHEYSEKTKKATRIIMFICLALSVDRLHFWASFKTVRNRKFPQAYEMKDRKKKIKSGQLVAIPIEGGSCWEVEIPCAPPGDQLEDLRLVELAGRKIFLF